MRQITKSARVVDHGHEQAVEVDLTVTLAADTIVGGWPAFLKALQGLDGVLTVRIEDTPVGLVKEMVRDMGPLPRRGGPRG